jgi:hypothetical protein
MATKFGIHNASWCDSPDPAEVFEAVKAKAQWAENLGFVWFSVMDHFPPIATPRHSGRRGNERLRQNCA